MENLNRVDQGELRHDLKPIEDKVNDPKTTRGELTNLRDTLETYMQEHVRYEKWSGFSSYTIEDNVGYTLAIQVLLDKVQKRINAEEPQEIKEMRHELSALSNETMKSYKEDIKAGNHKKVFDAIRRMLEIEYSSKWKAADRNVRMEKFKSKIPNYDQKLEELNNTSYEQWMEKEKGDLSKEYGISQEQASEMYEFLKTQILEWDAYSMVVAGIMLSWLHL